jgi:hypothetical protein
MKKNFIKYEDSESFFALAWAFAGAGIVQFSNLFFSHDTNIKTSYLFFFSGCIFWLISLKSFKLYKKSYDMLEGEKVKGKFE